MPHSLEKFYNVFGGLNTRENRLQMNPDTLRKADNIRYSFRDELQKANGFQHKDSGAPSFVQQFEYRFRDINTGEAKSEILAVGTDGNLYRKKTHTLTFLTTGSATSYSVYYDEVSNGFILNMVGIGQVAIGDTTTLDQLKTSLNALAGVSVDIVDDAGNSVTSSQLAYLLDCVIENAFQDNSVFYWEVVPHPSMVCISATPVTEANADYSDATKWTRNGVPFPVALKAQDPITNPEVARLFEGISTVNLNNSIYITDGGHVMKYDGKCVYRAGMPRTFESTGDNSNTYDVTGITISSSSGSVSGSSQLTFGTYKFKARYSFTDYSGVKNYGEIFSNSTNITPPPSPTVGVYFTISNVGIYNDKFFPVFSAKVNGDQGQININSSLSLNVDAGHNILPGMVVRQYVTIPGTATRATQVSRQAFLAKVTSVTATQIVLQFVACTAGDLGYRATFLDNTHITGYYTQEIQENRVINEDQINLPGASLEIYRTKINQTTGPYYHVLSCEMPYSTAETVSIIENKLDNQLTQLLLDEPEGYQIPRFCKYLSSWQNQIVQAGPLVDSSYLGTVYPSVRNPTITTAYCNTGISQNEYYSIADSCDFQSIYWANALSPEGFPQDGLHEFAVDTFANDEIKGIAPNKDAFFAFKERSTGVLTGSLAENDIVLEILEDDIGCASHNSIQEVGGSLFWLDARKGFYSCVAGRLPVPVGFNISDYQRINAQGLDYSQAKSANLRGQSLYLCSVGTTTFVFDYANQGNNNRACWYLWTRLNGKSLVADADDQMLIYDGIRTWKMKITNTKYDFTDHKSAIPMDAQTAWITLGAPIIDKNFQHIWINSIQGDFSLGVTQWANYLDYQQSEKTIDFIPESSAKKAVKMDIKANLAKLSAISFGFKNSEKNKFVRIQGWEIEYAPDYDRGEGRR